jgi:iron transport multicopper oxidase
VIAGQEDTVKFTVNGTSFNPPSVPVLLQILNGKHDATELLPKGMVYPLPRNKVIQLTMPAGPTALIGGPVSSSITPRAPF